MVLRHDWQIDLGGLAQRIIESLASQPRNHMLWILFV